MTMIQILTHTPPWVFGLFIGLIFLGYTQTKTRQLSVKRLTILPLVMLALSVMGIASSFGVHLLSTTMWVGGIALAFVANHWITAPKGARYSKEERLFYIPGSWLPMVLIMMIFFTKYTVGVLLALHPEQVHSQQFVVSACLLFGLGSGLFFARAIYIYKTSTL
jgi:hypothetical protein